MCEIQMFHELCLKRLLLRCWISRILSYWERNA